jgi:RNA polymerase sigma-70 factor (ECF subfamily)
MTEDDDYQVVKVCLSGDSRAFETLVSRYQKPVFNVALRISNDMSDAEDITQNVFIKVFENLRKYHPKYKFFSWIYRMAINESINYGKKHAHVAATRTVMVDEHARPDATFENLELSTQIDDALAELNIDQRAVIILRHFEGFSYHEMSYILDIAEKTVKSRLFSARERLRDILARKGIVGHDAVA